MTNPITTQQTGKKWKAYQAAGVAVTAAGIAGGFALRTEAQVSAQLCFMIAFCGIAIFATGRIGAWWYHG